MKLSSTMTKSKEWKIAATKRLSFR